MWSSPVERRGADGSKYSLVLLDTEGIDAYDQVSARAQWVASYVQAGPVCNTCGLDVC